MRGAVHQLVPVLSRGDAIGSSVLLYQDALHDAGYRSDIFAGISDRRIPRTIHPAEDIDGSLGPDDSVVYHLSIGSPLARRFERLAARHVLAYHNITPAESVGGWSPVLEHALRWGRADLRALAPAADLCLADSRFNASELEACGAGRVQVVPLPVDLDRLRPRPATPPAQLTLLFVGRLAPHKRQDVLVRVLAVLRAAHASEARLVLAGGASVPAWVRALRELAERLGVAAAVEIIDTPVTDAQLGDLYAAASLFVCASEHEGFCVPLLEAMAFSLPVLAHSAGAVADTVGDAGIVVPHLDPLIWAELVARVATDATLRGSLVSAGLRRIATLDGRVTARALTEALATLSRGAVSADSARAR